MSMFVQRMYLDSICCPWSLRWQDPEYQAARWYDLFWWIIPMIGFIIFLESIKARFKDHPELYKSSDDLWSESRDE